MKRVLHQTPPWIVVPVSVLGASLLLALVQWESDRDEPRLTSTPSRGVAVFSTPPVAKHKPVAVSGDPLPHLLPRMDGDLAESATASDHRPVFGGGGSAQCLASSDAVSVLARADQHGLPVNTGWLPTNPNGAVPARPVPLLPLADQVTRPQVAAPSPRYGSNAPDWGRPAMAVAAVEMREPVEAPSSGLINSLFQPPAMEREPSGPPMRGPRAAIAASPNAGVGNAWQPIPQFPVPLPPVSKTSDMVQALPPVEPDPDTDEVEPPAFGIVDDTLDSDVCVTDDMLVPLPPVEVSTADEVESPAFGDEDLWGTEECVTDDVLVPLPPVEPRLTDEVEPPVLVAASDTSDCEGYVGDDVLIPLPPVEQDMADMVDMAEATPVPPSPTEPRLHGPSESVAIALIGSLFVPVAAESGENSDLEIGIEQDAAGSESAGGVTEEKTGRDDEEEEVPQPLPPVGQDLEFVETNAADEAPFDPKGYERSWDLELIAQEADKHARLGFELAGKKAHFSARLEFTRALRIIAQGLDTERKTNRHSQALAAGLRALGEAEDFLAKDGHLEAELDLAVISGAHRTPVLRESDAEEWTPLAAIQKYHTFAQEQMATAVGKEMAGSMALYGLGKLYVAIGEQQRGDGILSARSKAMVLLQAALIASPTNHMASNELGVLLARNGRQAEARKAFEHSVAACPTAEGWRNLALTCEQLGEMDEAYRAARETLALRGKAPSVTPSSLGAVHWVSPEELAHRGGRLRTASAVGANHAR